MSELENEDEGLWGDEASINDRSEIIAAIRKLVLKPYKPKVRKKLPLNLGDGLKDINFDNIFKNTEQK